MVPQTLVEQVSRQLAKEGTTSVGGREVEAVFDALAAVGYDVVPRLAEAASGFEGENLTPAEHATMSLGERGDFLEQLTETNRQWLAERFRELRAAWVMIVDGAIVRSGRSLQDYPSECEILEVCERTDKFPLVFVNEMSVAVEEQSASWHSTVYDGDFYPTMSLTIGAERAEMPVVADLDTGALGLFASFSMLESEGIVHVRPTDDEITAHHLSEAYRYIVKSLLVRLVDAAGMRHEAEMRVACVRNWSASPFTVINPDRLALIGRTPLLFLGASVNLDFANHVTLVTFASP